MKAKVKYSLGRTINTGNYENAKVEIGLELECEETDVKQAYAKVKKFVDARVKEEELRWLT
jgi:hypothetical protein